MRALPRRKQATVYNVTTAAVPMSEDVSGRQRRYLISMGIRMACLILAVALYGHTPPQVMALLLAGAIFLPYVSVILANGGRRPTRLPSLHDTTPPPSAPAQRALPAADPQSGT
ncbi:DUF3099 domain-containing protein [Actinocorallia lasiicapitis]